MRILTAPEMRAVDQRAITEIGVPSLVLMENAAIGVVEAIAERYPTVETVAVFCGPGNNGGDGLAVARHLDARGYRLLTYLVTGSSSPSGDAAVQLAILERSGVPVEKIDAETDLTAVLAQARDGELVVDALFGTGLSRPLSGHFADLVLGLGEIGRPVLAVDVPSGLDGSRAEVLGPSLRAEVTVTFAAPKVAHVLFPAAERVGEVVVTDLGIPSEVVASAPGDLHLLVGEELAACLLPRAATTHKGDVGHVLLVGGSPGKAGAAILAASAAVRGGAGLVTVAVPAQILATVDGGCLESMTLALSTADDGGLNRAAASEVLAAARGRQAVAIGPGLGLAEDTVACVRHLCRDLAVPLVLDADGLNALGTDLSLLSSRPAVTVLTPHPGEMARLLGLSSAEVQRDRLSAARRAAEESGAVIILKGHRTLIADPEGGVYVNPTGNPGMATGGSGDVLTGLLAALLAQGYGVLAACQLAVYLHGLAGDLAVASGAPEAFRAGDLLASLPQAFVALREA